MPSLLSSIKAMPVIAVLMSLGAAMAFAGPIEDRQALMKSNGKAMRELGKMFKGEMAYDAAAVKEQAATISADLKIFVTLLPETSKDGPPETWAKPEIWSDRAVFMMVAGKTRTAAEAVAGTKDEAGFKAAFPALGAGCMECHRKYRRAKE